MHRKCAKVAFRSTKSSLVMCLSFILRGFGIKKKVHCRATIEDCKKRALKETDGFLARNNENLAAHCWPIRLGLESL